MKIGPRYKKARYLGAAVFSKTQNPKFAMRSQTKVKKGRGRGGKSQYGEQMLEKQKARYSYGVSAGQFGNYVKKALQTTGDNSKNLLHLLESRLDNVIFRSGTVTSRFAARQMVAHGHLCVNGVIVTIPSYKVKVGEIITIREGSKKKPLFANLSEKLKTNEHAAWIAVDADKQEFKITGEPTADQSGLLFDLQAVLEFYTR